MKYKLFFGSLALPILVGFVSSYFTISSIPNWYSTLNKPFFNPPNWVFGPVWTTLYVLMGIALYLVLLKKPKSHVAVRWFFIQLILNFAWSFIFFGMQSILPAFVEIVLLWVSIVFTIKYFYKINKNAAYLLIPYLAWVTFASLLNFSIFLLNR